MKGWTVMQTLSHGKFWTWMTFQSWSTLRQGIWTLIPYTTCHCMHATLWGGRNTLARWIYSTKNSSQRRSQFITQSQQHSLQMEEWASQYIKMILCWALQYPLWPSPCNVQGHFLELRELFPQDTDWTLSGETSKSKKYRRNYPHHCSFSQNDN